VGQFLFLLGSEAESLTELSSVQKDVRWEDKRVSNWGRIRRKIGEHVYCRDKLRDCSASSGEEVKELRVGHQRQNCLKKKVGSGPEGRGDYSRGKKSSYKEEGA